MTEELFVTTIVGFEPVLEKELHGLGYKETTCGYGGVTVKGIRFPDVYRLNFLVRTASRVLWPLAKFPCDDKEDLYRESLKIDWAPFFQEMPTLAIDAHINHPEFRNSLFAAQVLKDAICDQLRKKTGERPDVDTKNPDIRLNLFIDGKEAVVSFDTSNRALHERGYRKDTGDAPLRETLAAALLLMGGYTGEQIFCDPCCGSGTFLIEAAMIATNTPPQFLRRGEWEQYGFLKHPEFSESAWDDVQQEALAQRKPLESGRILGIEKDKKTFDALHAGISRAGFAGKISTLWSDFQTAKLPFVPNFVLANPPYGKRLQDIDSLIPLYRSLGDFFKKNTTKPAKGFILSGNVELSKQVGLKTSRRHIVNNGGIECRFLEFDLY